MRQNDGGATCEQRARRQRETDERGEGPSTAALADVWRGAGVRVICLARLNGLAWEISRARKLVINAFYDEVRAGPARKGAWQHGREPSHRERGAGERERGQK